VKNTLELHELNDGSYIQDFPIDVGTVTAFSGKKEHSEIFFQFQSYLTPGRIYRVDFTTAPWEATILREIKLSGFDASKFVTTQVFYSSKDGTRIPMFIVHKKVKLN
jgi:prolyl oligopeptidase